MSLPVLSNVMIPPWVKPVAILLLCAAIFGSGMYLQSRLELADRARELEDQKKLLLEAHEAQRVKLQQDLDDARASERDLSAKLEVLTGNYDDLMLAVSKLKPQLVIRGKPDAQGNCTGARLSPAFRLCWNAAVAGTAEAVAACNSAKLPDPVP